MATGAGEAQWREVASAIGAPDFVLPWLDRFYRTEDAELVRLAATQPDVLLSLPEDRLSGAVRRAVLDVDRAGSYSPASFHARFEIWAMFEGWKDVPRGVHHQLGDWELQEYAESIREPLEALRDGRPVDAVDAGYTYLLLREAEDIIRAKPHIYLWPCDCRAIIGSCRKPANVCLRFENDRGIGWELSRERALLVLKQAHRAGLMQTGYAGRDADAFGICNCCTDCCFPHLATAQLGTKAVWPRRRHVASVDVKACIACGRCADRCPFGAITCGTGGGRAKLDPDKCRGCGLCATACGPEAVTMQPLGPKAS